MIDMPGWLFYFYEIINLKTMKKAILFLFILLGTVTVAQAQLLNKLKTKTTTVAANSVDRSADKVVDKTVTQTTDNTTDKALNKAGEKMNSIFKKKNKKTKNIVEPVVPASDSVTIKTENQNT